MRASKVAAFGKMNTFGGGPCLGATVCLETELEAASSVDWLVAGLVDLVRAMALRFGWVSWVAAW
jgi:hypothetical protein